MSPLAWLAVPVVATLVAAVAVPWWLGRGRAALSDEQRAGIIGDALAPRRSRWLHRRALVQRPPVVDLTDAQRGTGPAPAVTRPGRRGA